MVNIEKCKIWKYYSEGFTLIELIIVLSVLGIISAIAIPSYVSVINYAEEKSCDISKSQIEKIYKLYLLTEDIEHSDIIFEQFLNEYDTVCPLGSSISYFDDKVRCDFHDKEKEVPYL